MLAGIEAVLLKEKPQWALVYGDTISTLAGALAVAKQQVAVAHVEVRKVGDRIGDLVNSFERSGFAVVTGRVRAEAVALADRVEETVVFDMEPLLTEAG